MKRKESFFRKNFTKIWSVIATIIFTFLSEVLIEGQLSITKLSVYNIPIAITFGLLVYIAFEISRRLPKIENSIEDVNKKGEITEKLFYSLESKKTQLTTLYRNLFFRRQDFLKDFGKEVISDYLQGIKVGDNELSILGKHWSLRAYIKFWRYLNKVQESIDQNKGEKGLILRITHSNDINIWNSNDPVYRSFVDECCRQQKKFVQKGGKIVRVLLGPEPKPSKLYENVMQQMQMKIAPNEEEQQIEESKRLFELKYLQNDKTGIDFDFLYILEMEVILKWESAGNGGALTGFTIIDKLEHEEKQKREVEINWSNIYYRLEENNDSIKIIPESRQFHIDY